MFKKGDVIELDFDPQVGAEVQKIRPAVVISNNSINRIVPLVTVVPLRSNLQLAIPGITPIIQLTRSNGLSCDSFADMMQIKSMSIRRVKRKLGKLSDDDLAEIIANLDIIFQ